MPLARLRPAEPDSDAADTSAAVDADGAEGGGLAEVEVPAVLHDPSMPDFVPTEEFQQVLPGAVRCAEAPAYLVRRCACSRARVCTASARASLYQVRTNRRERAVPRPR
jgi:hypothetical protein